MYIMNIYRHAIFTVTRE